MCRQKCCAVCHLTFRLVPCSPLWAAAGEARAASSSYSRASMHPRLAPSRLTVGCLVSMQMVGCNGALRQWDKSVCPVAATELVLQGGSAHFWHAAQGDTKIDAAFAVNGTWHATGHSPCTMISMKLRGCENTTDLAGQHYLRAASIGTSSWDWNALMAAHMNPPAIR